MIDFFKKEFQIIADENNGVYNFREEIVGGIGFSSLPVSFHKIIVPDGDGEIIFDIEFGGTSFANVYTQLINAHKSRDFQFKKIGAFQLLFARNKQSLRVAADSASVRKSVEALIVKSKLESIARDTLFEPSISIAHNGSKTDVKIAFSMAFERKEEVIRPVIEFLRLLRVYMAM